jgi:hypothetical protein
MSSDHPDVFIPADLSHIARFSKQEVPGELDGSVLSVCPMCAVSLENFEGKIENLYCHIAQELFDYALLSLKYLPGLMGLLRGESERFPSSKGNETDQGAGKRWPSEVEQDETLPWSLWLTGNDEPVPDSPKTEVELEILNQDMVVHLEWNAIDQYRKSPIAVFINPLCFQDLEKVWESIQIGIQIGQQDQPDRTLQSSIDNGKKKAAAAAAKTETNADLASGNNKEKKEDEDEDEVIRSTGDDILT